MLKLLAAEFVENSDAALDAALSNLDEIVPGMPYLDKPQYPVADAMFICASVLSLYIHLRHQGVDVHKYGARYVELSKMRPLPEEEAEGEEDMGEMLAAEKMHPGEFDFEIVQGDGKTFDFGYNVKSCAICHVFSQHDAMDLVPYMCAFDDVASDLGDMGLRRTGTIAVGASHCDFRYKKGREPQHLAEVYPEKIRLLADDKPLYYETHPLVED